MVEGIGREGVVMPSTISSEKQKAIDKTLDMVGPYLWMDHLNDVQAARIGRELYANLRQAEREEQLKSA